MTPAPEYIRVNISRHKGIYYGNGPRCVGDVIERHVIMCPLGTPIPRVDELLTHHPDGDPNEKSWTGRVSGIQHVFSAGSHSLFPEKAYRHTVCLTVVDDHETQPGVFLDR